MGCRRPSGWFCSLLIVCAARTLVGEESPPDMDERATPSIASEPQVALRKALLRAEYAPTPQEFDRRIEECRRLFPQDQEKISLASREILHWRTEIAIRHRKLDEAY